MKNVYPNFIFKNLKNHFDKIKAKTFNIERNRKEKKLNYTQ